MPGIASCTTPRSSDAEERLAVFVMMSRLGRTWWARLDPGRSVEASRRLSPRHRQDCVKGEQETSPS